MRILSFLFQAFKWLIGIAIVVGVATYVVEQWSDDPTSLPESVTKAKNQPNAAELEKTFSDIRKRVETSKLKYEADSSRRLRGLSKKSEEELRKLRANLQNQVAEFEPDSDFERIGMIQEPNALAASLRAEVEQNIRIREIRALDEMIDGKRSLDYPLQKFNDSIDDKKMLFRNLRKPRKNTKDCSEDIMKSEINV